MARGASALAAAAVLLAVTAQVAVARDRELRAILEPLACVPERIVANRLSPTVVVYEVTCKGSARVVQVECLESQCRLLVPARDDDR
jgi:hypothetical protein